MNFALYLGYTNETSGPSLHTLGSRLGSTKGRLTASRKKWLALLGVFVLLGACRREPDPKSSSTRLSYGLELEGDAPKNAHQQAREVIKRRLDALKIDANV